MAGRAGGDPSKAKMDHSRIAKTYGGTDRQRRNSIARLHQKMDEFAYIKASDDIVRLRNFLRSWIGAEKESLSAPQLETLMRYLYETILEISIPEIERKDNDNG